MTDPLHQELDFIESTLHKLATWTRSRIPDGVSHEEATEKIDMIQVALMKLHTVRNALAQPDQPSDQDS